MFSVTLNTGPEIERRRPLLEPVFKNDDKDTE
jgi:hypothetical protein